MVLNNPVSAWLISIGIALAVWTALGMARRIIVTRLRRLAERTSTPWDDLVVDALSRTRTLFLLVLAIAAGAATLDLGDRVRTAIATLTILAGLVQAGLWASAAIRFQLTRYQREKMELDRGAAGVVGAMSFVLQLVLWSGVLLLALDNMGVDITTLVTTLGVGGVAIALAVQNVLGDLFASLAIVLDKPFILGDFIIVDDKLGSVEKIGLKTTRVRSLFGEQLIFSNADLLHSRIKNYGRMAERRVVFTLGVTYQTPREQLKQIPGILRESIEATSDTRFDRSHFSAYGAFSLDFESVFYVLSPDYNIYMDRQQDIFLAIHERFEAEGIEFAYPTQTLFLDRA